MPSIKDLKKRITSVKNTQQTTKAMKMVSAAKLRRAQDAIYSHRPYARQIDRLIRETAKQSNGVLESPLISTQEVSTGGSLLLVVVTSDRGLCGAFNGSVVRTVQRWAEENATKYSRIQFAFIGKKGLEAMKRKGIKEVLAHEFGGRAVFPFAQRVTAEVLERFKEGEFTEVRLAYNEFKNAISQRVVVEPFLPISPGEFKDPYAGVPEAAPTDPFLIKPSSKEILAALLEKHFAIQMFRVLLESQASEHGARMTAMDNATRNAGEVIRKLTLAYNKQRQANITKELLEIISGSESQKQEM